MTQTTPTPPKRKLPRDMRTPLQRGALQEWERQKHGRKHYGGGINSDAIHHGGSAMSGSLFALRQIQSRKRARQLGTTVRALKFGKR